MKLGALTAALAIAVSPVLAPAAFASAKSDAQAQVNDSLGAVRRMEQDPHARELLQHAKGVFVIPSYHHGGLIVGGRGGEGVLLAHLNNHWSDPAFYNQGGINIGAQAGGGGGAVVFILMTQKALNAFMNSTNFSLNAGSGLSVVKYSGKISATSPKADAVFWSDINGAYAGKTVGATGISADNDENNAYYGRATNVSAIVHGKVHNAGAAQLVKALPA